MTSDVIENPETETDKKRKHAWKGGQDYKGHGPGATNASTVHGSKADRVLAADCRFVVNVSSMEGKFYRRKLATHPHTNMAKAALNMLTRTSAGDYQKSNIFMTAVDTGYVLTSSLSTMIGWFRPCLFPRHLTCRISSIVL